MRIDFKDIIDTHKGKTGLVLGLGPSLREDLEDLCKLSKNDKENYTFISCNRHNLLFDIETDFWVTCNPVWRIDNWYDQFNTKPNCTLVYGDSVDLTPYDFVEDHIIPNYLPFDQRHFNSHPCDCVKCCKRIVPGRLTIQEELKKYTKSEFHYSSGYTVSLHMLAIAILIGCNPIYVYGVDMDYSDGYVIKNDVQPWNGDGAVSESGRKATLADFKKIKKMAANINVDIYTSSTYLSKIYEKRSLFLKGS